MHVREGVGDQSSILCALVVVYLPYPSYLLASSLIHVDLKNILSPIRKHSRNPVLAIELANNLFWRKVFPPKMQSFKLRSYVKHMCF